MKKGAISVLSMLAGGLAGAGAIGKISNDKVNQVQKLSDKHLALFLMMNHWVNVKQEGKSLSLYFKDHGYKKIAIYGMSYAGETLVRELDNTEVEVVCGIDKKENLYTYIDVVSVDDPLPEVDAIVVTAITFFDEIEERLSAKVTCPIVSLEDILYEV